MKDRQSSVTKMSKTSFSFSFYAINISAPLSHLSGNVISIDGSIDSTIQLSVGDFVLNIGVSAVKNVSYVAMISDDSSQANATLLDEGTPHTGDAGTSHVFCVNGS